MPPPTGPRRPSPEELAKQIAARLAETGESNSKRSSLRNSVLVGRLVSGTIVLSTAAVLVLGIFAGVDLLLDDASVESPQVLSLEVTPREDDPTTTNGVLTTQNLEDFIGLFAENPTETTGFGLVTTTIPGAGGIGVPMPGVSNTSTTAPAGGASTTVGTNATTPAQVTTTQPPTTSSSGPSITSTSTTTSTVPMPTIPATTPTVTIPSTVPTTLTIPTTTTIEASTTTLFEDTTTTCGNKGSGKGNC